MINSNILTIAPTVNNPICNRLYRRLNNPLFDGFTYRYILLYYASVLCHGLSVDTGMLALKSPQTSIGLLHSLRNVAQKLFVPH